MRSRRRRSCRRETRSANFNWCYVVCSRVFARPEHPLALFLDDLQWLDAATLDVLEDLLTQPDLHHLLLIGTYRDDEVTPAHPLRQRLAGIREAGGRVQEIILNPLETRRCEPHDGRRAALTARVGPWPGWSMKRPPEIRSSPSSF